MKKTFARQFTQAACLGAGLIFARPASAQNPRRYSVNDLGTLGGPFSIMDSINNAGVAVGAAATGPFLADGVTYERRAFVWDKTNGMRTFGTLGGPGITDEALAVNNAGTIVGHATTAPNMQGVSYTHAFVYDAVHGMRDLTPNLAADSFATALNDNGAIVGGAGIGTPDLMTGIPAEHAVIWDAQGSMTDIGILNGTFSEARAINNAGTVVGYGNLTAGYDYHSFVWDSASGIRDIGIPGGPVSNAHLAFVDANSINNKGEAVGTVTIFLTNGTQVIYDFIWDSVNGPRSLHNALGITGFVGAEINNDSGLIGGGGFGGAALYDPALGLVDLSKAATTAGAGVTYRLQDIDALSASGLAGGNTYVIPKDPALFETRHAFLLEKTAQPTLLASDVTAQVKIKRGGYRLYLTNYEVDQLVTITNTSGKPIPGPLSFAVVNTKNADLFPSAVADYVNWHTPLYAPYVDMGLSANASLLPGQSVSVTLRFQSGYDPTFTYGVFKGISYNALVFGGAGAR